MVWFSSPLNVIFDNVHDSFVSWLSEVIKSAPVEVVTHTLSLCYGLWWARNKCCFEGKTIQPVEIVRKAWHIIEDFQSTLNSQNSQGINAASNSYQTQTCWIASPPACYKINVDVAGPLDGFWGIGAIVRDNVGCIYVAATWKLQGLPEVDTAEATGMHNALTFAQEMGFLNLHAETDSLQVVLAMNSRKVNHFYFGRIILDCIEMSNYFNDFLVLHVKREGNKVAHKLAKFALANPDSVWLEEIPPCIALDLASEFRNSL